VPTRGRTGEENADSSRDISRSSCSPSIHFEYVVRNISTLCPNCFAQNAGVMPAISIAAA
jgi:hypothetical protein